MRSRSRSQGSRKEERLRPRNTSAVAALALAATMAAAAPAMATGGYHDDDAVVVPKLDCVQPTQYGYVAHFTYKGEDLFAMAVPMPAAK